jgi:small-conductance mechanosensitive channel
LNASTVADLVDAATDGCGPVGQRRWLCDMVSDHTTNHTVLRVVDWLSPWVTAALVILGALIVNRVARAAVRRAVTRAIMVRRGGTRRAMRAATISDALRSLVSIVVVIVTLFAVLAAFGVNLAPLLAGAGLAGVVIGFGAQNLLRDVIAGTFMVFEDQFGVGDCIDTGLAAGTVESVTLRVTRLRDDDGVLWHVPNGAITRVANMSALPGRDEAGPDSPGPDSPGPAAS